MNTLGIRPVGAIGKASNRKLSGNIAKIYALVNPFSKKPFYIGSTKCSLTLRLWHHMVHCCGNFKKAKAIRRIVGKGSKPLIVQLCECPVEYQHAEEMRWINGALRLYKLTNIVVYEAKTL